MRVKIVHGNDAGSIHDYDEPAARTLIDSGFAVLAPPAPPDPPVVPPARPRRVEPPVTPKGPESP